MRVAGRYRDEGPLGRGGMGEVRRAFDELLGRAVALKMVPHTVRFSAEALQREARALAGLSHPAIAAIFDLVRDDDRQYLVLELVEGESLAQVLARGRPGLELALSVASQVARGLEAAHGRGLIHRDLKPENVMVTAGQRAKILDFGLAIALTEGGGEGEPRPGPLAGTVTAMSPEQVERRPLDPRSDLFSFGILLYQLLTGEHPFRSSVPVETMQRILGEDPPPVRQLAPDVPAELEQLVARLLAKDPQERPVGAGVVAATLERSLQVVALRGDRARAPLWGRPGVLAAAAAVSLAGAVGAWVAWWGHPPPPLQVAVLSPAVEGAEPDGRPPLAAEAVRAAAVSTLAGLQGVYPIAAHEVDAVPGGPAEVARAVAADETVTTEVAVSPTACRVSMSRLASDGRTTLWMIHFEVPGDDPRLIAETVAANLRRGYRERRVQRGFEVQVGPEAYAAFLEVRRDVVNPPADVSWVSVLDRLNAIRRSSPALLDAAMLEASVARYLFESTGDDAYRRQAEEALESARGTSPDDPRTLRAEAELCLAVGNYDRAGDSLARLQALDPTSGIAATLRARLAQRQGRPAEALADLSPIVARRPSWWNLVNLAQLQNEVGDVRGQRRSLEDALDRAPHNVVVKAELASLEMYSGDPDRALDLYLEVVAASPAPHYLSALAALQLLLNRPGDARATLQRATSAGSRSPATLLNLADCASLQGEDDEARDLYLAALQQVRLRPRRTRDDLSLEAQCLAQLGRDDEARVAISQAIAGARPSGEVAFAAALVYSVIGDADASREWANRAAAAGVSSRYFQLPWFRTLGPNAPPVDAALSDRSGP